MISDGPGFVCRAAPTPLQATDAERRLAELVRLWGLVNFVHPALATQTIDWEAAFIAAADAEQAVQNEEDHVRVLSEMLDVLDDPKTRIARASEAPPGGVREAWAWEDEHTLVVDVSAIPPSDWATTMGTLAALTTAEVVVFDLRKTPSWQQTWVDDVFTSWSGTLLGAAVTLPSWRTRVHRGFISEGSTTSGTFYSGFEQRTPLHRDSDREGSPPRSVFVVGGDQVIPALVLVLRAQGSGAIVAEAALHDGAGVPSIAAPIGGDRLAVIRSGEIVLEGARPIFTADVITPKDPITVALELSRKPFARGELELVPSSSWRATTTSRTTTGGLPGRSHRLLAAAKLWNAVQFFHPYHEMIGDWDGALLRGIRGMNDAQSREQYIEAVLAMQALTGDGHAFLRVSEPTGLFGKGYPPFEVRVIDGSIVVTEIYDSKAAAEVRRGDVIAAVDGRPVSQRFREVAPLRAASTPESHRYDVANVLLRGPLESPLVLRVIRDGKMLDLRVNRLRRPGSVSYDTPPYRLLEGGAIGFADLTRLQIEDVPAMFTAFAETDAIIFDMRGYPNGTAWTIAPYLDENKEPTVAALVRRRSFALRSTEELQETFTEFRTYLPEDDVPKYRGQTWMLIDERAVSQAEHTGLLLKAANGTRFVGSPTAGTNGDITTAQLPGGITAFFTGQAILHPNGDQLQRVGLVPDLAVRPTIAGITSGRDEVLEAAVAEARRAIAARKAARSRIGSPD